MLTRDHKFSAHKFEITNFGRGNKKKKKNVCYYILKKYFISVEIARYENILGYKIYLFQIISAV